MYCNNRTVFDSTKLFCLRSHITIKVLQLLKKNLEKILKKYKKSLN